MSREQIVPPELPFVSSQQLAGFDNELAYTLPIFKWGSFRVTRSADKAFGLMPLVPVNGPDMASPPGVSDKQPSLDIWLMTPDEGPAGHAEPVLDSDIPVVKVRTHAMLHGNGVAVILRANTNRGEVVKARQAQDLLTRWALFQALPNALQDPVIRWQDQLIAQEAARHRRTTSRIVQGLGIAAIVADRLLTGQVRPSLVGAGALAMVVDTILARKSATELAAHADEHHVTYLAAMRKFVMAVTEDIKEAYDPDQFESGATRFLTHDAELPEPEG